MGWPYVSIFFTDELKDLIQLARREDLGPRGAEDDVTSRLLIAEDAIGVGTLLQKSVGIACGLPIVEQVCRAYDERLRVEMIPGFHMEIIEGGSAMRRRRLCCAFAGRCGRCFRRSASC